MKNLKKITQSILSIKLVRSILGITNLAIAWFFSLTYILSVPFHWIVFFPFMREQRAVLKGKVHYYKNLAATNQPSKVALRRNIHRLEKALIMRPRRPTFAKDYILETVEWYKKAVDQWTDKPSGYDESELIWAHNVLTQYFAEVKDVPTIKKARQIFAQLSYQPERLDIKPYLRPEPQDLPSYEQLLALSQYRRSVRWYLQKKVPRKDIDDALMVARQAPTACNRLPYEFRIYDDPELVKKVANTPFGTGGYADNIPVIAVLVGKLSSYFSTRDRHAIYVDTSLAAMSFAFALETKGISTCMINWPDFEPLEAKMQKLLGLSIDERPIMLMAIGFADPKGMVPYSQKKALDVMRSYNKAKSNE